MARIGELAEANAGRYLQRLEASNPGAHFLSRHGAATSLDDQAFRAMSGLRPDDGVLGPIVNSSRFMTNVNQMHSIDRAISLHRLEIDKPVATFEYAIGEGFEKMLRKINGQQVVVPFGPHYFQSNSAQVYFRNGLPYTAFPTR